MCGRIRSLLITTADSRKNVSCADALLGVIGQCYCALMQRTQRLREGSSWDDVRLFLALCRSRTVGEAAAKIAVDPSTVSRRLATLEQAMGVTLFDRGRDGIAKTKAAEDLMTVAEETEAVIARFANAADGLEREVSGLVRIACPPDVADAVVVPVLGDLLTRHPALRVALEVGEAVVDLSRREADLALRTVRPVRGDLVVTRLARVTWVLAGSAVLARKLGKLRSWSDAPWIGWGERLAQIGPSRWLAEHAREVDPVVRSDSLMVQISVLKAGVGVALIPSPSVAHYGLTPITIGPALRESALEWPQNELFLVSHRALRDVPRVRVVWERLVAQLGGK